MTKLFTLLFSAIFVLYSCDIDFNDTKVPVNTTVPLADFNISESMLLSWAGLEDDISVGDDDILQIGKSMEMEIATSNDLKDLFNITSQTFSIPYNFGGTIPVSFEIDINPAIEITQKFVFDENNYSINSAILNDGELNFNISNTSSDFSNVSCVVKQLTKNNIPLTIKPGERKSLKGYKLTFDSKDPNAINFSLSGKISAKAGDDLSNVKLNISFSNLQISDSEGFFGRNVISPNEDFTINLDPGVTDFFKDCTYYLSNPQLKLQLDNAYNLPILIQISKLKIGNTQIQLKDGVGYSKIFLKPGHITEYVLSNQSTLLGTELSDALSNDISSFTIAFTVITNPTKEDLEDAGYIAPTVNSLSLNRSIKIQENLSLPFEGTFTEIPFNQEFNMDLDNDSQDIIYEYMKLGITCKNEMPFKLNFTLVAISDNDTEVVLFENPIDIPSSNGIKPSGTGFKAGLIDESNAIIQTINGENVKILMNAKKLKFVFKGSMPKNPEGGYSKLYSPSALNLKLTGNLKGEF